MMYIKSFNESQNEFSDKENIESELKDILLEIEDKNLITNVNMGDYPNLIIISIISNREHYTYETEFDVSSVIEEIYRITNYLLFNGFSLRKTNIYSIEDGYTLYNYFPNMLKRKKTNQITFVYEKIERK